MQQQNLKRCKRITDTSVWIQELGITARHTYLGGEEAVVFVEGPPAPRSRAPAEGPAACVPLGPGPVPEEPPGTPLSPPAEPAEWGGMPAVGPAASPSAALEAAPPSASPILRWSSLRSLSSDSFNKNSIHMSLNDCPNQRHTRRKNPKLIVQQLLHWRSPSSPVLPFFGRKVR